MKILVTAGATREPIDAVRFLSNVSTGATGAALADELARRGHAVTVLKGTGAVPPKNVSDVETFSSSEDLLRRLQTRLSGGDFAAVVMAAAVADYRPNKVLDGKMPSDAEERTLRLVRNEKILPRLQSFAARPLRVVGFKLTVGADAEARRAAVSAQFAAGGVDAVVHNDLVEIRSAPMHPFWIWRAANAAPIRLDGVVALAAVLEELLGASPR
jgi:phosphopantothenoylcysteine synthetase/decarboxylase